MDHEDGLRLSTGTILHNPSTVKIKSLIPKSDNPPRLDNP